MHSWFPGATSPSLGLLMTSFPHDSQWPLHHDQKRLVGWMTCFSQPTPPWLSSSGGLASSCPGLGARVQMIIWKMDWFVSAVF